MAKIEGTYEFTQFLKRYPLECNKIILKALRASGRPLADAIRRGVPVDKNGHRIDRWKKMVGVKAKQSKESGRLYMTAGYRDNGKTSEHENEKQKAGKKKYAIREWTKAYWMNNGTLRRRDPSHEFRFGIRARSKNNRNQEGQPHKNFYEKSVEGMEPKVKQAFIRSIEKQHEQLIKLNAR